MRRVLLSAAITVALAATAFPSQEREPIPERSPPQEVSPPVLPKPPLSGTARWRLVEPEIELSLLVELCARGLGAHVEYDASKLTGSVALDRPGDFSPLELWDVFNRALASRGLTTVQPPGYSGFRVVPIADATNEARVETLDLQGARAGFIKVVRGLDHQKPEALLDTLRSLLSTSGSVQAVRDANALLIADFRPHVEQALSVLALLDLPAAQPLAIEVPLENVAPVTMSALVDRIVNARKAVGEPLHGTALALSESQSMLVVAPASEVSWWRTTIEAFDRPEPVTTLHYVPRRFGLHETARLIEATVREPGAAEAAGSWRMVEDGLTGTLILTTTPKKHAAVQDLLTRLEATDEGPRKPLRAFPIQNRRVSEVLGLLEGLLDAGVLAGATKRGTEPSAPGVQGATAPIVAAAPASAPRTTPDVTLAADEATSRILAFGEARLLDELGRLIDELDVRQAQVLIEALVVTLSESQTRALAVELQSLATVGTTSARFASIFGSGPLDPASTSIPAVTAPGFSAVVLDPGDFSAVVRALETLNRGRSVMTPKVLVNNNVQATLDSTLQTPYASTNASTTVATTSFGGTLDAGTRVTVKPQVADGDQIVIEYSVSLSSFVGEAADPALPPPRQETRLASVVTIPDGFTVVVGGLEIETEGLAESRVPWLGEIPLVGALFRDRSKTATKSRFFVFLRCSVMRNAGFEDLKYASQREVALAGVEDGFPVHEARVIR